MHEEGLPAAIFPAASPHPKADRVEFHFLFIRMDGIVI